MSDLAISETVAAFSDDQISAAARLFAEGVGETAVALATALEVPDLAVLRQDPRYKTLAGELNSTIQVRDIQQDDSWNTVEEVALVAVAFDLKHNLDGMSPMEKLAIAKQANMARRRHGVLADRNKSGRMGDGVLDAGNGAQNIAIINMPVVMVDRMKELTQVGSKTIEHEAVAQTKFEAEDLHAVELEDVTKILDVELDENQNDGSASIETVLGSVFDITSPEMTDQELAAAGVATDYG